MKKSENILNIVIHAPFEDWMQTTHGEYMKGFSENIIKNLDENLNKIGVLSIDDKYDRLFDFVMQKSII